MEKIALIVIVSFFIVSNPFYSRQYAHSQGIITSEEDAIKKLSDEIYQKKDKLLNKKVAVFNFSNLEGKEIKEGKRLSKKLLVELMKHSDLRFIERAEISKILKAQGIEQTGIVDTDLLSDSGKVLPVDIIINGTIAQIGSHAELTVKVIDSVSGEIYSILSTKFYPDNAFSYKESREKLHLHQRSPDKIDIINKTYNTMLLLAQKRPYIFLISLYEKHDSNLKNYPDLLRRMKVQALVIKRKSPYHWRRLLQLRKGVKILKKYDRHRYEKLHMIQKKIIHRIHDR